MAKTLAERLRDCAQGVSLGADGMGWSPDPALLEEAADKIVSLHAELQHARDGLTRDNERLAREAHEWWTAARDAANAERARCALRVALHSQYPIQTDYDRGYDKARKDAAETLRTMGDDAGLELGPNVGAKATGAAKPCDSAGSDGTGRADVASVEHAARRRGLEMTDAAYRQLMKHAHRLAMDGHGELAQFLRDAMTDAQRYAWLRGNAVREKALGDKFIEFHCDFESWNDIDAAIDKARIPCAHEWKVTHEGVQYMDSRCARCGATKRETWD